MDKTRESKEEEITGSDLGTPSAQRPTSANSVMPRGVISASELQKGGGFQKNGGTNAPRREAAQHSTLKVNSQLEVIRGEVERVRFKKAESDFVIFELKAKDTLSSTVVVGNGADIAAGLEVIITGEFVTHPRFGAQFKARNISIVPPSSTDGITKYLASGVIPGIGPTLARRVAEHFGGETLNILERTPERIQEVSGIGSSKAHAIATYLEENKSLHEITRFLTEHHIQPGLANRIYKRYGNRSIERLKQNPYLLARDVVGVGFRTADSVALRLGIELESPERHRAGLLYSLERARDDGHCFLPREALFSSCESLLETHPSLVDHEQRLRELHEEKLVSTRDEHVYLTSLAHAEEYIATFAVERLTPRKKMLLDELEMEKTIRRVEGDLAITFSNEQRKAVHAALSYRLLLLTGGPGCGKTTVTRAIVEALAEAGCNIALTAPTGRAAQRMSQVCNLPAKTIHRLLRFDPFTRRFIHNESFPIEQDEKQVDAIIVDESSMIDLLLAQSLFSAIPHNATIILVGDKDQLPSVGPGRVFGELLSITEIPTITLSQLYRREETSRINDIAYQINAGLDPQIPEPDGVTKSDAYFLERTDSEEAASTIERLFIEQIPKKFGIAPGDITVLTPSNRGPLGTIQLNERLQRAVLGQHDRAFTLTNSDISFYEGDRVCQRKNNYQIDEFGVFNGDTGTIVEIDDSGKELTVELWDGRLINYSENDIQQLTLAYALTVHRSQGSEIPCVVLALNESHYTLLERQLIYTAVTRAKKLLIVVGSRKSLSLASRRAQSKKRFSSLKERIETILR